MLKKSKKKSATIGRRRGGVKDGENEAIAEFCTDKHTSRPLNS